MLQILITTRQGHPSLALSIYELLESTTRRLIFAIAGVYLMFIMATALWHEASPIYYVDENTPPILFLISAQPRFSLGHQEMIAKMRTLGVPYRLAQIPDAPHSFWLFEPWLQPSISILTQFLDEQFTLNRSDTAR